MLYFSEIKKGGPKGGPPEEVFYKFSTTQTKKFHEKFGFKRVGNQKTEGGTKEVLMMEYSL